MLPTLCQPPTGLPREVVGVALFDKCLFVVYHGYNKVQLFDCAYRFEKIKDILVQGLRRPNDMVGSSVTSQLFVSGKGKIWRVNIRTGFYDVFIELDGYARLSLFENRLLVTSRASLLMYDIHSGQRTKNIPWTEDIKTHEDRHAI